MDLDRHIQPQKDREKALGSGAVTVGVIAPAKHYRTLLARVLRCIEGAVVIDLGSGDKPSIDALVQQSPDVAIVDLQPSALQSTLSLLRSSKCVSRVVAINVPREESTLLGLVESGVAAFVDQSGDVRELLQATRDAMYQEMHCDPWFVAALVRRLTQLGVGPSKSRSAAPLTRREREILGLVNRGLPNKVIARELGIELSTVKNHVHNILTKSMLQSSIFVTRR